MPLLMIALGMMLFATKIMVSVFPIADDSPFGMTQIEKLAETMTGPLMTVLAVVLIAAGGFFQIFGIGALFPAGTGDPEAAPAAPKPQPVRKPSLSPVAKIASDRASAALARLRSMPADTFTPEARTEYEAIRDKHLPSLRAAHTKARAAFPAEGQEAATLDADLAGSLNLISGKLDELIEDCGDEARTGFDVERRFVELRHPSEADPLALPSVHMVEKGE